MKKTVKKMLQWLTTAIFTLALVLGISITLPTAELAQAETAVVFSSASLDKEFHNTYGTSIRFNTEGLQWNTSHNWVDAEAWKSIADYTTVNGRTVTEINEATTNGQKITLMMQPAGSFSFLRLYIPAEIISIDDVKAMGILEGWSFNNGTATYTAPAVTFLRSGDAMIESGVYSELTKKTSADITIGTAQLVNPSNAGAGTDSYVVNIDMGMRIASEYDTMYNGYKSIRRAIYINGKSIEEWNAQKIAEDARFNDPSTYTRFPQNSSDASHKDYFVKPIGLWGTETGLRLSIFQELVADIETVTVTVGEGCMLAGSFMVAETVTKTVHTQEVVNVVNELTFLDNSHDAPKDWGATNLYYIHTNNKSRWTKAPVGGCLNEADPASQGGGQIQMKYIYFNDISVWELNQKYNGAYGSTQGNIASGSFYAPILVEMSSEVGSSLKLTVPTAFDGTEAGNSGGTAAQNHRTITIKKGFSVYENGVSYYVSNDITFTNNNGTWTKKVTPIEYETEVTGIATYANRTDGATNDNFIIFNLSNHDYEGVREQPILDLSGLLNKIVIGVNTVTTTPSSPYFNVWGIGDSIAFRAPGLDASGVAEIETITIKAGAKFPSYQAQYNGGAIVYYVTTEDVTFYHNVPNDEWSLTPYAKTYTVTFLNEDGTTYETQRVKEGKQATAPVAPTKPSTFDEKYTFNGWYNGNVLFDFNAPITEDVTLTVNFTASATEPVHADVSVTGVKYGYNGTFISFLLSAHDATGLVTDLNGEPYKYDVAASGLLNFIEINGNPLLELVPKTNNFNPHFNVYDATKHDLSIRLPETFDFGAIQTVTLKSGAQFPSLAFLNKTEKKYYTTTEDVTYIVYGDGMMSGDALKDTVTEMDVEVTGIVYRPTSDWTNAQKDNANFLMFKLKGHDYPSVAEMGSNKPVSVATLLNIGFFNKIELYGHEYGETAGTERRLGTFAEIIAAYGQPGEAYINLWGMDNSFGIRLPYNTANDIKDSLYGHTTITKVVIKSGAQFPSYQKFVAGATDSDYRLVSRAETTFVWNESWGMFTKEDKSSGIWMEKGASVRLGGSSSSVNNNTSVFALPRRFLTIGCTRLTWA